MDWKRTSVAITGATGFIGGHVVGMLRAYGASISILLRDPVSNLDPGIRVVSGDVRDPAAVERLMAESTPHLVIHLAAVAPVGLASRMPRQTISTNVMGTVNVLEAAREYKPALIVASSDKAYGIPARLPVHETMLFNPHHLYDVSKASADMLTTAYADAFNINAAVTRLANVYGPGDAEMSRLVPYVIRQLLLDDIPIIRSNGKPIRSYLYVMDAARSYLKLGAKMLKTRKYAGMAFNVSGDERYSVMDVYRLIEHHMKKKVEPHILGAASDETMKLTVDGHEFANEFDWRPQVLIDEGLERTIRWMEEHLEEIP